MLHPNKKCGSKKSNYLATNGIASKTNKRKSPNGNENSIEAVADPKAKKLTLKKHLNKVINVEEINQLQASEKLFHSNFFHLQIDELLKETKLSDKRLAFVQNWFNELTTFLTKLEPELEKQLVNELKWLKKKEIIAPISQDILYDPSIKFFFQFLTPKSVFSIGSWRTSTMIGVDPIFDVGLEIPPEFFHKGNNLNGIYHQKRALYLSYIALQLSKWNQIVDCKFTFAHADPLQPIIALKPAGKYGKHITIHLHAVCGEESFKIERFSPEKSNVKQLIAIGTKINNDFVKNTEHTATPHYNSSVLHDLNTKFNEEFLCNTIGENVNVQEAIILLKVWLRQRGLDRGYGGFTGYIITMCVAHAIQNKRINLSMNCYQIIRQIWIHLGNTAWNENGNSVSLYESKFRTTQPQPDEFHKYYDVVFIDPTGYYNICSNVSLDIYKRVKQESELALRLLNDGHSNSFHYLFATKIPLYLQLDHIIRINSNIVKILQSNGSSADFFDYCGYWYPNIQKIVFKVLRQGLGSRIHGILPINTSDLKSWEINQKSVCDAKQLQFGLILNAEFAFNIQDKGPQPNLPEAEDYRRFWGPKSELRRFWDGAIGESCLWCLLNAPMVEKRLICKKIVLHLLNYHFKIDADKIAYTASQLDDTFAMDSSYDDLHGKNNAEHLAINVIKIFDELAKSLRSMDKLPLVITSVLGKSPVFHYCELIPVFQHARKSTTAQGNDAFCSYVINEVVIQFESSGKWPNELAAIERVKAAFYLQIGKMFRQTFHLQTKINVDSVDVIKDKYLFRFRIAVPRELALYKKEVTTKGVTKYRDTPESLQLERELFILPYINVSLHSLYHTNSSFGAAVLIAKRWLYAQLIDPFLWPDECTELLIAYDYKYGKNFASVQPQTGFFKFLHMLANMNWQTDMILLNFNNELSNNYIEKLETKFLSERDSFPPLTIITSNGETDKHTIWTKKVPTIEILARITLLARHAISLIEKSVLKEFLIEPLFNASLDGYDLVIILEKKKLREKILQEIPKPLWLKQLKHHPIVPSADYHPVVSYLKELRSAYDHVAVFFYNPSDGQRIAVLWKPIIFTTQEFKLNAVNGQQSGDNQLEYNLEQLKNDFLIIGQGLVTEIIDNRQLKMN